MRLDYVIDQVLNVHWVWGKKKLPICYCFPSFEIEESPNRL